MCNALCLWKSSQRQEFQGLCLYGMKIRLFVASVSGGFVWMNINEVGVPSLYNSHIHTLRSIMWIYTTGSDSVLIFSSSESDNSHSLLPNVSIWLKAKMLLGPWTHSALIGPESCFSDAHWLCYWPHIVIVIVTLLIYLAYKLHSFKGMHVVFLFSHFSVDSDSGISREMKTVFFFFFSGYISNLLV